MIEEKSLKTREVIERTAHGDLLLNAAFGTILDTDAIKSVADIGAGDSTFYTSRFEKGQVVTRIDKDYIYDAPEGDDWFAESATELSFEDGQFDAAVSSFMLQHLDDVEQKQAISEMIRVTKKDGKDKGFVGLFPVYNRKKVAEAIKDLNLDGVAAVEELSTKETGHIATDKLLCYPTLWIYNSSKKQHEINQFVTTITEKGVLNKRLSYRDKLGKLAFKRSARKTGSNRWGTPA